MINSFNQIPRALVLLAILGLTGCVHRTAGNATAVWQLRGAVVTVQPGVLTVRHKTGQLVQLVIDDQTVFTRGHARDSAAALKPGTRVTVIVETSPQHVYRARQISLWS
jgi:hypothetical protein